MVEGRERRNDQSGTFHLPPLALLSTRPRPYEVLHAFIGGSSSLHDLPAVRREPLLRQEATLVIHLARTLHPIAQIYVGEAHAATACDVIEDHERAERSRRFLRIEARIDHREPIAEHISERDREQVPCAAAVDRAVRTSSSIFDHA